MGQLDGEVRAAVTFAGVTALVGLAFVAVAAIWAGSCDPAAQTMACGRPYRSVLAVGGPLILAAGGVRAFLRTLRLWRDGGSWWGWPGAGWFLMTLMVLVFVLTASPIIG